MLLPNYLHMFGVQVLFNFSQTDPDWQDWTLSGFMKVRIRQKGPKMHETVCFRWEVLFKLLFPFMLKITKDKQTLLW